ncbi:phage tail-collar fiber domain-containing protein [Pseudomonas putida]
MGASITLAGERLIAQKEAANEGLDIARFIFANVPGLIATSPVNRSAGKPPAAQIVHTQDYTRKGFVNPNQVIYSVMLGSDIGDWDFNWIGLETADNVLLAVAYVPLQQKRKNIPPLQIGNNLTRNMLIKFDGAQQMTGITVDASTWQHDFTVRLTGIDQRERQSNRDIYGRALFIGDGLAVERSFGVFQLKPGRAYVEGIRLELADALQFTVPAFPAKVWLNVALERSVSDVVATCKVVIANSEGDRTDSVGVRHYLVQIASIDASGQITDLRTTMPIAGAMIDHFAVKDGDYPALRARGTTKADVGLGNLPNSKSDDPGTNSSEILATTAALKIAMAQVESALVGMMVFYPTSTTPSGFLRCNGAAVSRTAYARLFTQIGTFYGAGDGVTTFNLPNPRGRFLRVLDDGQGLDVGRVLGSLQADELRSHAHTASSAAGGGHTHTASAAAAGGHAHTASSDTQGAHTHTVKEGTVGVILGQGETLTSGDDLTTGINNTSTTSSAGGHAHNITVNPVADHAHTITVNSVADHTHTITVNAAGGTETRPVNAAYPLFIKY